MKSHISKLALIIAMATFIAPAFAQAPPSDTDTIVVTASRTQLEPREVGSAITVTTEEDIQQEQILFVKDVLQEIPGVQISSDRPGDFTNVSIRGSDNDQVLFLLDGIELGDPSSITTSFQADHITSLDVARIEVLRGNQSSLYGSDAIGGVVNIITQRATEDGIKVNAEAEGGENHSRSGGVSVLGRSGGLDYRLTATGFAVDGPSLVDPFTFPAETEDDKYKRSSLSGRVGYEFNDTLRAQIVGFYSESESDTDDTFSPNDPGRVEKDEYGAAVQVTHETTDKALKNELTVSRYNAERHYFGAFNLPEGDLYDGTKDAALWVINYRPMSMVEFAGGLNWEKEETEQVTGFSGVFDVDITTQSIFAEVAIRPMEALSFTVAARVDDNSRFGTFDTYRATAAYFLPDLAAGGDVKFRASYGTGAKAPGLYQLFDPSYGNANLEVETSEGYDAGVGISWDKAQVELTVFDNDVTNEIGFDGSIPPFGGYAQFGETKSRGVEIGARIDLADNLSIVQSATALDSENAETGVWKGRPRYSGSTAITYRLTEKWDVTARARYRSRNASSFGGATDSYEVVDFLTSYKLDDRFEIYGRVVNATDEQYQLYYGGNAPDKGFFAGIRFRS